MDTALSILAIVIAIVAVVVMAILLLRFADRFTLGKPLTPEESAEVQRRYEQRLLHPQWRELEGHFGFAMPRSLRELYANHDLLRRTAFYFSAPDCTDQDEQHCIARFEPVDMQTLNEVWFNIGENCFPFASDDFGNYFCVKLSRDSQDVPVYFVDHDGGDVSRIADSLTYFLKGTVHASDRRTL